MSGIETRDPDEIVEHTYSRLRLLGDGRLSLLSNFPGGIEIEVSEIDVRVVTDATASGSS